MKTIFIFISLLLLTFYVKAQQWNGFNTTSIAWRTGWVGIGTSNPLGTIHVYNGVIRINGTHSGTNTISAGGPMLMFGDSNDDPNNTYNKGSWGIEYIQGGTSLTGGLNFWRPWPNSNYGNYFMYLGNNGNIGMGTGNIFNCNECSEYKLFVKKGIKTEKVKVEIASANGWADYVFDDDYKLMPLNDLENYIEENNHLPNIPSSQQVVENGGIELKEMNVKLLEKVEELTLYVIEQQKQLDALKEKVSQIDSEKE